MGDRRPEPEAVPNVQGKGGRALRGEAVATKGKKLF